MPETNQPTDGTGTPNASDVGGVIGGPVGSGTPSAPTAEPTTSPTEPTDPTTSPTEPTTPTEPTEPTEPPSTEAGDDFKLDRETFNQRIAQAKRSASAEATEQHRAWLRETYGTDNPDEVKAKIAESKKLQEAAEKQRREEMTELERTKADLAAERRRREAAEQKAVSMERQRRYDKQDARISGIAAKHVDKDLVEDAALLFARFVKTEKTPDEAKKMSEKDVDKWFKEFVKRKPAWAAPSTTDDPLKPKPKQPVTTGSPPEGQPSPTPTGSTGKTLRPGQANSMTKDEVEAYKRDKGYQW